MNRFIALFGDKIIGALSGFDRVVFRGYLRRICYAGGLTLFLNVRRVRFKDFKAYVHATTEGIKNAVVERVQKLDRPVVYVPSSTTDKEALARKIAREDGITGGLVAVLKSVEPCSTFGIGPNPKTNALEVRSELGKCLFLYYYFIDPVFGWMNARLQTWFPFNVQVCINGREWLARQLDAAGVDYQRRDNCFPWIEDFAKAQVLMNLQRRVRWKHALNRIMRIVNPRHDEIFQDFPVQYYWSAYQTEWATDLAFDSQSTLDRTYPGLMRHAITCFGSGDVMRFLGRKVHGAFQGEITSDFSNRPWGVRVKHWVKSNSLKMYNKEGSILRVETTLQNTQGYKVYRSKEGDPQGVKQWLGMRNGIADLHRRTQVSQAANERYLDGLAQVQSTTPLGDLLDKVCKPVTYRGKRIRGLRPWLPDERKVFALVLRGEFMLNGLRNADLRKLLWSDDPTDPKEKRRRSARVSHLLRILRAHGVLNKVPKSHLYRVTPLGKELLSAVISAHQASLKQLIQIPA